MSTQSRSIADRLRQPEYTGENRCIPCTIVNTVIALVASGLLWFGATSYGASGAASWLGIGSFVVFAGAIYFRGYLVPGTPELTKQYFPRWLLEWFGKTPEARPAPESSIEPEEILNAAGVIQPCMNGEDLCLTEEFQAAWRDRIAEVRESGDTRENLAEVLDTDPDALDIESHDEARLARLDGQHVGQWESEGALVADLAAEPLMAEHYGGWEDLEVHERSRVLVSLRIFLEECPTCGGPVQLTEDQVESCCSTMDVVAAVCGECESRLLEVQQQG